jgi:hypothetical protein
VEINISGICGVGFRWMDAENLGMRIVFVVNFVRFLFCKLFRKIISENFGFANFLF